MSLPVQQSSPYGTNDAAFVSQFKSDHDTVAEQHIAPGRTGEIYQQPGTPLRRTRHVCKLDFERTKAQPTYGSSCWCLLTADSHVTATEVKGATVVYKYGLHCNDLLIWQQPWRRADTRLIEDFLLSLQRDARVAPFSVLRLFRAACCGLPDFLHHQPPRGFSVYKVTVHDRRETAAGQHISPWPTSETWRDAICLEELTRPPGFPWLCSRMRPMSPLPRRATQRSHRVQLRYKDEASRSSATEATVESAQASVATALHGHGAPRIRSA
ncbi:uncharacterized protein LOC142573351 [Dermacentor variabilis]|uniref:uncharacterized protein LOC142573351 n=1 Tax=Dermacentor variabilis TaxID=34621 RepID=UPI003F5C669F